MVDPIPGGTREQHLAWAKQRALAYVDAGEPQQAFTSLASDLRKHDQLQDHPGLQIGMGLLLLGHAGGLRTPQEMREFIEGFY